MITFYPENDGTWNDDFIFNDITLVAKQKADYKIFRNRAELRTYICNVKHIPMAIVEFVSGCSPLHGYAFKIMISGRVIGWAKDNYLVW